jgi:predicted PurR-regulated permease PerM
MDMVPTAVLVTVVLAAFAVLGGAFYAMVHVLGQRITDLGTQMNARFAHMDSRFAEIDSRFAQINTEINSRFGETSARFDRLEARIDAIFEVVAEMGRRITALGLRER